MWTHSLGKKKKRVGVFCASSFSPHWNTSKLQRNAKSSITDNWEYKEKLKSLKKWNEIITRTSESDGFPLFSFCSCRFFLSLALVFSYVFVSVPASTCLSLFSQLSSHPFSLGLYLISLLTSCFVSSCLLCCFCEFLSTKRCMTHQTFLDSLLKGKNNDWLEVRGNAERVNRRRKSRGGIQEWTIMRNWSRSCWRGGSRQWWSERHWQQRWWRERRALDEFESRCRSRSFWLNWIGDSGIERIWHYSEDKIRTTINRNMKGCLLMRTIGAHKHSIFDSWLQLQSTRHFALSSERARITNNLTSDDLVHSRNGRDRNRRRSINSRRSSSSPWRRCTDRRRAGGWRGRW